MHEDEDRRKEIPRLDKKATACAAASFIFERRCVTQNDDLLKNESLETLYQITAETIKIKRTKNSDNAEMLAIFISSNTSAPSTTKNIKKFTKKLKTSKRENSSENPERKRKKSKTAIIEVSSN